MNVVVSLLLLAASSVASPEAQRPDGLIIERQPFVLDPRTAIGSVLLDETTEVAGGARVRKPAYRYLDGLEISRITYWSDGLKVKGFLLVPKEGGKHPSVIYVRGGQRDFSALDDAAVVRSLARLASRGYVVAASQFRGAAGGEGRDEFGGADIGDVLNLLPLLDREPAADASRVGILGHSRGGLMTYLALARSDRFKAAIVISGVADAFQLVEARPEFEVILAELVPGYAADDAKRAAALESRSPVRWAGRLCKKTPILVLHGTADANVDASQALDMASKLLAARHPFRLALFEGAAHGWTEHGHEARAMIDAWLDRFVRDGEPPPDVAPRY
jgi:dipeptidyl aminopeptidase/acylaminoacyl peptidase